MTHQLKKLSDTQVLLTITCDESDLTAAKQKTLGRLAKKVKVAGFRPGKVPAKVAEKHIDANVLNNELLEDAVNKYAMEIIETTKITPVDRPKVEVKKYVPGKELEFTAEIEILPEIKLGDYKKLKATKETVSVTAKDVTEVIDRMRASTGEKAEVKRAAKMGDEATIDFVGTDKDGKKIEGGAGTDYPLTLGSNSFIPGFEEGLVGKKAGEKAKLDLAFPKDYHHKPLAGAKVSFDVTVKTVKETKLPELNDEFAAKAGPFKTVADFKADVKRELTDQKEREALDKLKDSLIEQLVKGSHVPTPEVLIADQIVALERDFTQNLMYRGQTLDQFLEAEGLTKEEWHKAELREPAIRRVQVGLALAELTKAEDIQVSMEELETRLAEMLQQYGNSPEVTKQLDTPEARRDLANRILTEKTVSRLVDLNTK